MSQNSVIFPMVCCKMSGNVNPFFRTSRPWRSNSLTPPTSGNLPLNNPPNAHEWIQYQAKGQRSHSLTYVRDSMAGGLTTSTSVADALNISPATSASTLDEKEIEDMIRNLHEGSGMRGMSIRKPYKKAFEAFTTI